jgi:hypothetical protein
MKEDELPLLFQQTEEEIAQVELELKERAERQKEAWALAMRNHRWMRPGSQK